MMGPPTPGRQRATLALRSPEVSFPPMPQGISEFAEVALPVNQPLAKLLQGDAWAEELLLDALDDLNRLGEVTLLRQFLSHQPAPGRLLEQLKFSVLDLLLAQLADNLAGSLRVAGLEKRPHLRHPEPRERLPQPICPAFSGL